MLAEEHEVAPRNDDERRIDAVLFDCDGVLVDSERVAAECIVEFAARFGARFEFDEALERFTGARMADNLRDIEERGKCKLPDDFEDRLRSHMAMQFETRLPSDRWRRGARRGSRPAVLRGVERTAFEDGDHPAHCGSA